MRWILSEQVRHGQGQGILKVTNDSTAKRLSHREAREDRQENAKSQIIIQDNLRHDSTFLKCS
jgi:hypothetical protein